MLQTKKPHKTPEEELSEVYYLQISNLPNKEFKVLIIKDAQKTEEKSRWTMGSLIRHQKFIKKDERDLKIITEVKLLLGHQTKNFELGG